MSNLPDNWAGSDVPWLDDQWFDSAEWLAEQWAIEVCEDAYLHLELYAQVEEERQMAAQAMLDYPEYFWSQEVTA